MAIKTFRFQLISNLVYVESNFDFVNNKGKSRRNWKLLLVLSFCIFFITTSILVIDKKSAVWEQFNESDIISYVNSGEIVLLDVTRLIGV